jgi:RNA polymerase sigma-70 factor (ECF subfamily)
MPDPDRAPPFDEVYEQCVDRVYRYCLWLLRDPTLAQDITAETFLKAYQAYSRRQPDPETVHTWLFRIARNLVSSHRSRERRWSKVMERLRGTPTAERDAEAIAGVSADLSRALRLLSSMNARDQQLIAFHVAGELTLREIGALLGMSEGAATVATHRALERIRRLSAADDE